jgi:hypothetical protein
MKNSDFELPITSVRQAGRIKHGEMEPARKLDRGQREGIKAIRASPPEAAMDDGGLIRTNDPVREKNSFLA